MREYQTQQRRALLELFRDNRERSLSADDVLKELPAELQISRSAVYRNLDKMERDGLVSKTLGGEGRKVLYQYAEGEDCCKRVHLKCEKCGKLLHMENESDEERLSALLEKNGFQLDEHSTVLVGVCKDCKPEEKR